MRTGTLLLTLAFLSISVFSSTTSAQTPGQMSAEEFKRGRAYLEAKDYARAIEHYNNSIAIMPSSAAFMDLGITYHRLKRYDDAIKSFKQVVRMVPNNPDVHYWLAWTYQNKGNDLFKATKTKDVLSFQNAESEAREALRFRADYHDAYFVLGNALFVLGKYVDSLSALQQALRTKPDDHATMYLMTLAYAKLGRKSEAMRTYESLSALDREYAADLLPQINNMTSSASNSSPTSTPNAAPGSAEYYANEGYKQRDAKNYAQAIASLKRAIALKPSLANAHFNIGYCHYLLDQYTLALPSFQQAVKLEPTDNSHHYWLGVTYFQLKRYQPALLSLQEALRLKPDDAYSHYWLGEVHAEGFKQYDKAIPEYRESIRLDPEYALSRNQFGLALSELDELDAAVSAFQEAIRIKPAEPLYYSNLGLTYVALGRREDAVVVQRKLQTLDQAKAKNLSDNIEANFPADKDNSEFLLTLAAIVSDRPATALPIYRRVLLIKSLPYEKAAAYRGMGDAYKAKDNDGKATAAYLQALSIYQRLLRLQPKDVYLHYGLGRSYLGLGQKEQALQVSRRMQTLDPKVAKELLDEINKAK